MTTLAVRDETVFSLANSEFTFVLQVSEECLTVRDLIRARVQQEVQAYNTHHPELFRGLVQPAEAERVLNGFRLPPRRSIDWEQQFEKAIEAFERNGFILLINNQQVDDLDAFVSFQPDTTVTFLKLIPLVGG